MNIDDNKIDKAIAVLKKMADKTDPITDQDIESTEFLNDPRIIRCFYYIIEILNNVKNGVYSSKSTYSPDKFIMTAEEKSNVIFPDRKIGVNEFSKCINNCIDLAVSRKLSGVELNKRLKKLGVLSEEKFGGGKTRTVTNDESAKYGFESEEREFNGRTYYTVVINDKGKKYLLDNIETIMAQD